MNAFFRIALEASFRSAMVASCVGAVLVLARVRNGAVRHGAWTGVLCAMLLMPVLPYVTPGIGLPAGSAPLALRVEPATAVHALPINMPAQSIATPVASPGESRPAALPATRGFPWPLAGLFAYLAGALTLLARLIAGWRSARLLVRTAEPVDVPSEGIPVYQSDAVTVPLTIGVVRPSILLPRGWAAWPATKLRAVLAHEAAHARRRDALVALAAHLNRCLFWFHPLAWWLERKLAATAEQAADEAAVRVVGEGRAYAQVLLEMAEAVRRSGGRLAWEGVAMDGDALERRIERILRPDFLRRISRKRRAVVAIGSAAAIFLAAACHDEARRDFTAAARNLTDGQVATLEAAVGKNPDDFDARRKLLAHYYTNPRGSDAWLPHYLWMIEHHPEDRALALYLRPNHAMLERVRKLWLAQADRDGRPAAVYANAFEFFRYIDKPMAEKMLLRTKAADPKGETVGIWNIESWSARFGDFYAGVLTGYGSVDPRSAYAAEVRQKLESSKDVMMLLSAAGRLVGMMGASTSDLAFGKTLIRRAQALQPDSTWARQLLNMAADQELTRSLPDAVWQGPLESRQRAIKALSAGDRFRELSILAIAAGDEGVRAKVIRHDAAAERAAWQKAGKYAQDALDIAPEARDRPDSSTAFFNANMVLGMAAVKAGDARTAAQYLLKAADAPATDALKYPIVNARPWAMNWHFPAILASELLKAGQRDAVVEFLERYARITVSDRERCLEDATLIRSGKLPAWARS